MPGLEEPGSLERTLVGVPAARKFPHGAGFAAAGDYISLRDQAFAAIEAGQPDAAVKFAVRCLEEAERMAHRATADLIDAMRQSERAANAAATLAAQMRSMEDEHGRLQGERQQLEVTRRAMQAERHELRAALAAAAEAQSRQLPDDPVRGKGTRAAHRRSPDGLLQDLNAELRPDPARAANPAQFMELLRQFRIWAGRPSYRDMAAVDHRFTGSALHAALGRDELPHRHEMIDAIVAGCGGSDEDRRMWATAWRQLAMQPASRAPLAEVLTFPDASQPA
jgi:hypothetical protein